MTNTDKIKSLIQDSRNLSKELEEARNAYKEKAQKVFTEFTKAIFEAVPAIKTITWNQGTPSFNDGDPCTFSVHDCYFSNATPEEIEEFDLDHDSQNEEKQLFNNTYTSSYWIEQEGGYTNHKYASCYEALVSEDQNTLLEEFSSFIQHNEDLMKDVFGDGSAVTITKDGATTEEYYDGY